jgi:endonuclease YncB( thermonuclease family)
MKSLLFHKNAHFCDHRGVGGVLIAVFLVLAAVAQAGGAGVTDGDGLRLNGERIRLWGVDAPEMGQECVLRGIPYSCGLKAKNALTGLLWGKAPRCEEVHTDRYGRTVARCSVDGKDLGGEMVRLGWALDFRRYSNGFYAELEADARGHRRGLWAGEFERPSAWRKEH